MSETLPNLLSVETLENGTLRLRKLEDTRKADQVHGLFRCPPPPPPIGSTSAVIFGHSRFLLRALNVAYRMGFHVACIQVRTRSSDCEPGI